MLATTRKRIRKASPTGATEIIAGLLALFAITCLFGALSVMAFGVV